MVSLLFDHGILNNFVDNHMLVIIVLVKTVMSSAQGLLAINCLVLLKLIWHGCFPLVKMGWLKITLCLRMPIIDGNSCIWEVDLFRE